VFLINGWNSGKVVFGFGYTALFPQSFSIDWATDMISRSGGRNSQGLDLTFFER
jgi:hypothetical protein